MLATRPLVLVQPPGSGAVEAGDGVITVIAVYNGEAPLPVATRRVFDGETRFDFPTGLTEGLNKTRLVYSYSVHQWRDLLQTCAMPQAQGAIKQIMIPLLIYFREVYPENFGDMEYDPDFDPELYAEIARLK